MAYKNVNSTKSCQLFVNERLRGLLYDILIFKLRRERFKHCVFLFWSSGDTLCKVDVDPHLRSCIIPLVILYKYLGNKCDF